MGSEFDWSNCLLTFDLSKSPKKEPEKTLDEFLDENKIEVDESGNFEMYLVVDLDDNECEPGAVIYKHTETLTEKAMRNDIDESSVQTYLKFNIYSKAQHIVEKQKSIREKLLTIEDKVLKVLLNKENVVKVYENSVAVTEYKVIEELKLNPTLKFKILSINQEKETAEVVLYNSITNKSKIITIEAWWLYDDLTNDEQIWKITSKINRYLDNDQSNTDLINSLAENGEEL